MQNSFLFFGDKTFVSLLTLKLCVWLKLQMKFLPGIFQCRQQVFPGNRPLFYYVKT